MFKGGQKDMPFLPLIWVSYGMAPTNSTYLGSGTNRGMYAAPGIPDALVPMLNADGDMPALFLGDPHLPWGNASTFFMGAAVDQDNPPETGQPDMVTRLVSWCPTNIVLETVPTKTNYFYGIAVESTTNLARPRWLDVANSGWNTTPPVGSKYQFSVPIPPGQTQRFFGIRDCSWSGMYLFEAGYPGLQDWGNTTNGLFPAPTNFAIPTPIRPTNILHTPYTGPGPVVAAAQPLSFQPKVSLSDALASLQYSPAEAQASFAKSSAQSSFMAASAPAADDGELSFDHDGRVVLWRSKTATKTRNASSKASIPPDQLRAKDPAGFYAPYASADRFIAQFSNHFGGANPMSGFRAQIAERDGLGMSHVRYRQSFEGLPVFGTELVVHVDANGQVTTANGLAAKDPAVSVTPTADLNQARETALSLWRQQAGSQVGGRVVLEELEVFCPRLFLCDSTPEFSATDVAGGANRPNMPENDVVPGQPTGWVNSDYLTWRIRVAGEPGEPDLTYFVDAHNGKPRWVLSNRMRLTNRQIY